MILCVCIEQIGNSEWILIGATYIHAMFTSDSRYTERIRLCYCFVTVSDKMNLRHPSEIIAEFMPAIKQGTPTSGQNAAGIRFCLCGATVVALFIVRSLPITTSR